MKKTVACLAMIAGSMAVAKGKPTAEPNRKPDNMPNGMIYVGCKPAYTKYTGDDEYKNNCVTALKEVEIRAGFGTYTQHACAADEQVVVSSIPVVRACLPPGAVEL